MEEEKKTEGSGNEEQWRGEIRGEVIMHIGKKWREEGRGVEKRKQLSRKERTKKRRGWNGSWSERGRRK